MRPVQRAADSARGPILRLEDVSVEIDGRPVLEKIAFDVRPAEFVGLVGPNGAGKTTLLKVVLGLVPAIHGRIEVLGHPPGAAPWPGIGYVPQRQAIPATFPASVTEVALMGRLRGLGVGGRARAADREAAATAVARVGLAEHAQRPVGTLSGGQQRRALLAQALAADRRLLILDEPTLGLDLPGEHAFYALLRRLQTDLGLAVVAVSHDLVALAGECDRLLCINRRMHVHGNPDDVIHSHAIQEAYACEFDFLAGELARHEGGSVGAQRPPARSR